MHSLDTNYSTADAALMRSAIQRVATGPELSKNLSYDEARSVMHAILQGTADDVQSAVYMIGLRMKRETEAEFKGTLDALRDTTVTSSVNVPELLLMADPYNGFNRTLQGSLFVLPVLAACGLPCCSHGVELVGPKYGVTHHTILKALGGNPDQSSDDVATSLADPSIGWGYLDQSRFNPPLYALNKLRTQMIKRPVLSTAEVLLSPLVANDRTHLMTGYVHKPYRETYEMLARHCGFDSLLLVRGTEGGVIPSFRGRAHVVRYSATDATEELDLDLSSVELDREYRAADIPDSLAKATPDDDTPGITWDVTALARLCADEGLAALDGKPGPLLDAAVLGTAMALWHTGKKATFEKAVTAARDAISSGRALQHLQAGL